MNLKEEYFNSFSKNDFEVLVRTLESQGYVIDGKKEEGLPFSSVQIEHMSQDMYNRLCTKYNISSDIEVSTTGHYYPEHGAYYIVFNEEFYDYNQAKNIMDKYINTL
jgi:hypothetical protein